MGYILNGYKILGQEIANGVVKHRAGIGTAISIGGTVVSNILSTRAGAKSARMIDAKSAEIGRELTLKEKAQLCWQNHIAPAATAGLSCVGAGYSHNQHVKDFNKLATGYAVLKKTYDSAKLATKEVLGEKKNAELQDKLNQKYIEEHPEVKEKILEQKVNPDPQTMQRYWEPTLGETFYATKDIIEGIVRVMQAEMAALKPRNGHGAQSGVYGVKVRRFYELGPNNFGISKEKMMSTSLDRGFNKGKEENGSDDDIIGVYYTPMMLNDDRECCIAINWELDPSDMTYGDYIKS